MSEDRLFFVNGRAQRGAADQWLPVLNPATGETIARAAKAEESDLASAIAAAEQAFLIWSRVPAFERYGIMRLAAQLLRERTADIAASITREEGKPLAEATGEVASSADVIDWFAEEGRRAYGRIIPSRSPNVHQQAIRLPVGPVAAFSPWNFPIGQAVKKVAAALAAGCSIILKPAEETPSSALAMAQAFADAGLPKGTFNVLFGVPQQVSRFLITHPVIRKVSFTGSTTVGAELAELAGRHIKQITLELGGHAPVIVMDDCDAEKAASVLAAAKFRNCGQICASPTRFLVHSDVHRTFVDRFESHMMSLRLGDGLDSATTLGPLANQRQWDRIGAVLDEARTKGATVIMPESTTPNRGLFRQPAILLDVPTDAVCMNEEPFGPLAIINRFERLDEAVAESNRVPYGLAAFAFTNSAQRVSEIGNRVHCGMLSVNHYGLGLPEIPFGGAGISGFGHECGSEGLEPYLDTRLITIAT